MHRFYIGETKDRSGKLDLTEHVWINDFGLANQIIKVLRMREGEQIILFDGEGLERLYKINELEEKAVHLVHETDMQPRIPKRKVLLAWSLLKKDKNEWVIQKATELGVSHFLPIITERTEKTGFDEGRAHKIAIEASEQCGRHDIPKVQEPQSLQSVVGEYHEHIPVFYADMEGDQPLVSELDKVLVLVGPEGGWSDKEREYFAQKSIPHIGLGDFTLRAETACIQAVSAMMK
jgi:16S rRNA (uracil1498-N3)-methyltransferase